MPIYMDIHMVPGVNARDVAVAHSKDLLMQDAHACKCMTYWIDELRESVFCLIEAPTKEAVIEMHTKAHGLIPYKIIEVNSALVEAFLGRIYDPNTAEKTPEGFALFNDPSYRILVATSITDIVLLQHKLGKVKSDALLKQYVSTVRANMHAFGGREIEQEGNGFIICFSAAATAVSCALAIQKNISLADADALGFKMSINSGQPVATSNTLFGDTVQLAQHMCSVSPNCQVAMASSVKSLMAKEPVSWKETRFKTLTPQDEAFIEKLFSILEERWQNPHFDVDDYSQSMAMSQSQFYRKTIAVTGRSPNILIRDYRLERAKELMRRQYHSIAQVTFETGFSSPSYFTKCFKKKYGLLPMRYVELLQ